MHEQINVFSVKHLKNTGGMANSVILDQTALKEQSDQGLHCLLSSICPNISKFESIFCYTN